MSSIEALSERFGPAYRWLATGTVMMATISVVLSATIVNVAIPSVMGAFGVSAVQAQWLSTGFLAAMTATMLLADWANRSFGLRYSMIAALSLFSFGAVLGGAAPNAGVLTLARVLQGGAAGVVQPMAMTLLFQVFPTEQRGTAMGMFGVGVVLAPALGPWVGGLLIDAFDWRYVFYLGLPFSALGVVMANIFLPTRQYSGPRPGFDWGGFILLAIFLASLLNALTNAQRLGWGSDIILLQFVIAAACAVGFVIWERVSVRPMLDTRLFSSLPFASAVVVAFIMGAGLFGSTYLLPLFVQTIQGLTPTQAGLLLMPAGFTLVVTFPLAGRLSDRVPAATLIGAGMLVFAAASWLMRTVDINTAFWSLACWAAMSRIGLGLAFPALSAGSLAVLPPTLVGQGSGVMNFFRQLGGAFGVNLLTVLMERRTLLHADAFAATQTPDSSTTTALLGELAARLHAAGLPDTETLPAATAFLSQSIAIQARTLAFQDGFLVVSGIFLLALVPAFGMFRAERAERAEARHVAEAEVAA